MPDRPGKSPNLWTNSFILIVASGGHIGYPTRYLQRSRQQLVRRNRLIHQPYPDRFVSIYCFIG